MINKNVQIVSVEGKDVLTKRYNITSKMIYKGTLDDSKDVDKLKEVGKKIIKFNKDKKRYYTNDVVTITFKYACKKDKDLTDEEYERVESIKKVLEILPNTKENKQIIKQTKNLLNIAERKIGKKEIREQLYKYGFNAYVEGKLQHFVRYKRTSGSARVGKCLFINEKYKNKMIDWSFCGIPHEEGQEMDIAGLEAYISLPTSSAISRFTLKPENILLIEDEKSTFEDTVMATKFINEEYDKDGNVVSGDLSTNIETTKITNKIFDGESLLDKSVFEE